MLVCPLGLTLTLVAQIFQKSGLFLLIFSPPKFFTRTCQFFYTDISVISVTFSNSGRHGVRANLKNEKKTANSQPRHSLSFLEQQPWLAAWRFSFRCWNVGLYQMPTVSTWSRSPSSSISSSSRRKMLRQRVPFSLIAALKSSENLKMFTQTQFAAFKNR